MEKEASAAGATQAPETGEPTAVLLCASAGEDEGHCDHLTDFGLGSLCAESIDAALEHLNAVQPKLLIVLTEGNTPAREHIEALNSLPSDIALAILSERPARHGALAPLEGRATFLDRTMSAEAISAELRRLLAPRAAQGSRSPTQTTMSALADSLPSRHTTAPREPPRVPTVALVEDDPSVQDCLATALAARGYVVQP